MEKPTDPTEEDGLTKAERALMADLRRPPGRIVASRPEGKNYIRYTIREEDGQEHDVLGLSREGYDKVFPPMMWDAIEKLRQEGGCAELVDEQSS